MADEFWAKLPLTWTVVAASSAARASPMIVAAGLPASPGSAVGVGSERALVAVALLHAAISAVSRTTAGNRNARIREMYQRSCALTPLPGRFSAVASNP